MRNGPVVEEVRRHRRRTAERFSFDVRAIAEDARSREAQSGHAVVRAPGQPGERQQARGSP